MATYASINNQLMEIENPIVNDDDVCPICLEVYSVPCKGNCGHCFCANCILQYWTYKSIIKATKCPICKQKVTRFTFHEASSLSFRTTSLEEEEEELLSLLKRIDYYNVLHNDCCGITAFFMKMKLGFPFFTIMTVDPDTRIRLLPLAHHLLLLVGCICNMYRVGIPIMLDFSEIRGSSSSYYWVEFISAFTFCVALLIGLCRILWHFMAPST